MIDEEIKDLMISQEEWENMFGNDGVVTLEDNTGWVLGISVAGHGGSVTLLKDQRVVFYLKKKKDGAVIREILELPLNVLKK